MDARITGSISAALVLMAGTALAEPQSDQPLNSATAGEEGTVAEAQTGQAQAFEDVEELRDEIEDHLDSRVTVSGEIDDELGPNSFVLEGGGWFDDEIAVLTPASNREIDSAMLEDDADVTVTGTVRAMSIVELERELGWDLAPEIEVELEDVKHFIVADSVEPESAVASIDD